MSVVDILLETAYQDTQLLIKHDKLGDDFSRPRTVDFLLISSEEAKANTVRDFIDENQYGDATVEQVGSEYRILVQIEMTTTQSVLCSISGLMACLAFLFKVDYDGWGCELQSKSS